MIETHVEDNTIIIIPKGELRRTISKRESLEHENGPMHNDSKAEF